MAAVVQLAVHPDMEAAQPVAVHQDKEAVLQPDHLDMVLEELRRLQQRLVRQPFSMRAKG